MLHTWAIWVHAPGDQPHEPGRHLYKAFKVVTLHIMLQLITILKTHLRVISIIDHITVNVISVATTKATSVPGRASPIYQPVITPQYGRCHVAENHDGLAERAKETGMILTRRPIPNSIPSPTLIIRIPTPARDRYRRYDRHDTWSATTCRTAACPCPGSCSRPACPA
jgi:hypothetical protein